VCPPSGQLGWVWEKAAVVWVMIEKSPKKATRGIHRTLGALLMALISACHFGKFYGGPIKD